MKGSVIILSALIILTPFLYSMTLQKTDYHRYSFWSNLVAVVTWCGYQKNGLASVLWHLFSYSPGTDFREPDPQFWEEGAQVLGSNCAGFAQFLRSSGKLASHLFIDYQLVSKRNGKRKKIPILGRCNSRAVILNSIPCCSLWCCPFRLLKIFSCAGDVLS